MTTFGWGVGDWLMAKLGNATLKRQVRHVGGSSSLGVFVPKSFLEERGWSVGESVPVDFRAWRVTSAPKDGRTPAKPRKGRKRRSAR